jgi:hypothetical protein
MSTCGDYVEEPPRERHREPPQHHATGDRIDFVYAYTLYTLAIIPSYISPPYALIEGPYKRVYRSHIDNPIHICACA